MVLENIVQELVVVNSITTNAADDIIAITCCTARPSPFRGMVWSRHEEQKASRHDANIGVLLGSKWAADDSKNNIRAMMGNNMCAISFWIVRSNPFQSVGLCSSSVEEVVGCSAL